ncbi:MAG: 5'-3' exonuclease H3TH domain-containing protein [Candidatus Gracilibacteria bacterium]
MQTFVLIDGNAIVHRCYHAVPPTLTAPDGTPVNAVYGFTSILLGILEVEKPDYLAVAFDMKGPTFRHAEFADYKATRVKTDDALIVQFPLVKEVLKSFSVPIFEKPGLEADDYLGIVSHELKERLPDLQILIVTGDQDALQLVDEQVWVVAPVSGYTKVIRYDRTLVHQKLGVWPEQVADFKGLRGDSSDNLPGVPGIGEKTAVKLLEQFNSVENLYEHLEEVLPERIRALLIEHKDQAFLCKKMATILKKDGDLDLSLDDCAVHNFDIEKVRDLFLKFAFKSLLVRTEKLNLAWEKKRGNGAQISLF